MTRYYNWMNSETIFMNAATGKQVLKKISTFLVFSILSAIPLV